MRKLGEKAFNMTTSRPSNNSQNNCRNSGGKTHNIIGVWLRSTAPNPGLLGADDPEFDALLGVKTCLFVRAAEQHEVAFGKPTEAAGIITERPVFADLQQVHQHDWHWNVRFNNSKIIYLRLSAKQEFKKKWEHDEVEWGTQWICLKYYARS